MVNKKRIKGLTFKRGDKVFLLRKNLISIRPSRKLDYIKYEPFKVKKQIELVNYKL